jgi:hypothetical protein
MNEPTLPPLTLRGEQISELLVLLVGAYTVEELRILLRTSLDIDLDAMCPPDGNLETTSYQLIVGLNRVGKVREFLTAVRDNRKNRPEFQAFIDRYSAPPSTPNLVRPHAMASRPPDDVILIIRNLWASLGETKLSPQAGCTLAFIDGFIILFLLVSLSNAFQPEGASTDRHSTIFGSQTLALVVSVVIVLFGIALFLGLFLGMFYLFRWVWVRVLSVYRTHMVYVSIGKLVVHYPALVGAWGGAAQLREKKQVAHIVIEIDPRFDD